MPNFAQQVEAGVSALGAGRPEEIDHSDFVYASQLVYDAVRDIRRAVLMNRFQTVPDDVPDSLRSTESFIATHKPEELDSESELELGQNYQDPYAYGNQYAAGGQYAADGRYAANSSYALITCDPRSAALGVDPMQDGGLNAPQYGSNGQYNSRHDGRYSDEPYYQQDGGQYDPQYNDGQYGAEYEDPDYYYQKYNSAFEQDDAVQEQENYVDAFVAQDDLIEGKTARAWMRELPEEEKAAIQQQLEVFREEKRKLDIEIAKWDSRGNDIIMLAKQMCMIMMEMTDFTRGRGPLKTTSDVIKAAKKISEIGTKLNELCQKIAEDCQDSQSKNDLLAYLGRIILCCHQLNITSKVKADIQNVGGELIVSGLDSATSLIQAAKNLMNAVVYAVKASYVASTKYKGRQKSIVHWKMKPPPKKALVKMEDPEQTHARVRKGAQAKSVEPIRALSEFDSY